jgi:hypothetical protein
MRSNFKVQRVSTYESAAAGDLQDPETQVSAHSKLTTKSNTNHLWKKKKSTLIWKPKFIS